MTHTFDMDTAEVVSAGEGGLEVEATCDDCGETFHTFVAAEDMGVLA